MAHTGFQPKIPDWQDSQIDQSGLHWKLISDGGEKEDEDYILQGWTAEFVFMQWAMVSPRMF